ncbi:forkhead box protein M1 isoform X1 [Pantherophis guttatus]|uniref:Forkhead box protein M1 isoform X1 n=1 Tax=Pantherophis guttatus TaxID=94885 RepID=A0ABM3YVE6_PANGU|nr:forkhead box protein M1 isoform X1 [Pantherophis guttatus]XP_060540099.1 forkhead box protein M1 isoform X1 [Pantherophis guttatus]
MKSRSHQPLILKKRKTSRPGSPAETDEEARSPVGRIKQEQQGISRDLQGIPGSPIQTAVIGDRLAPVNSSGVSRSPVPAETQQSVLDLLATEQSPRKDPGLVSLSGSSLGLETRPFPNVSGSEEGTIPASRGVPEDEKLAGMWAWTAEESDFLASQSLGSQEEDKTSSEEAANSGLNSSLTNIQWLGKMTSTPLSSCSMKKDTEKENQTPKQKTIKSEGSPTAATSALWKESFSERPPYSYMAMIQFAINSTEKKRMMLKDIYSWIEDHFPYFKHVAKPGWKNSVRHNLSLHDMFVRETSANGKIAFWTIHPEANRYLTLDQVFKQQKRPTLDLQKNFKVTKAESQTSRPRIKPLLPRVSSYLVPVHFPASEPFHLQLPSRPSLPAGQTALGTTQINTGERPAPKILRSSEDPVLSPPPSSIKEEHYCGEESSPLTLQRPLEEGSCTDRGNPSAGVLSDSFHSQEWVSSFVPVWPVKKEPAGAGEEQNLCVQASPIKQKRQVTGLRSSPESKLVIKRQELGRSRRKQHLTLSSSEEPVLLLPISGGSTSFLLGHGPSAQKAPLGTLVCGPEEEPPVTCRLPIASTPNKTPVTTSTTLPPTDQWRLTPMVDDRNKVDFSSPRSSPLPFLPFQDNLDLELNENPLRQSLCDSPQCPLLNADMGELVPGLLNTSSPSSKVACEFAGDNSLLEDLVLDNMPENWSKLSLDISFPDPGNDNLETDLSWSQLLPQLK